MGNWISLKLKFFAQQRMWLINSSQPGIERKHLQYVYILKDLNPEIQRAKEMNKAKSNPLKKKEQKPKTLH